MSCHGLLRPASEPKLRVPTRRRTPTANGRAADVPYFAAACGAFSAASFCVRSAFVSSSDAVFSSDS
jgi:hypothetical protein